MSPEPLIVAGTASSRLAARLAETLQAPTADTDIRRFPDGEVYARIDSEVQGRHAVIVQTTFPNDNLVELLLLQDAAREAGAATVTAVVPYFGYARQDKVFKPGEAVSSRAVARAMATTADRVITVDPHKEDILDFFPDAGSVTAVPALADELGAWGIDCVLAPDAGARGRAEQAADRLEVPFDHLEKTRISATEVRIQAKELDVAGQRVAILDDMIASGGTMCKAAEQLKQNGAATVYAACTHGLFTGGAVPRLLDAGIDRVLCTDTVEQDGTDVVSAASAVAGAIAPRLAT